MNISTPGQETLASAPRSPMPTVGAGCRVSWVRVRHRHHTYGPAPVGAQPSTETQCQSVPGRSALAKPTQASGSCRWRTPSRLRRISADGPGTNTKVPTGARTLPIQSYSQRNSCGLMLSTMKPTVCFTTPFWHRTRKDNSCHWRGGPVTTPSLNSRRRCVLHQFGTAISGRHGSNDLPTVRLALDVAA